MSGDDGAVDAGDLLDGGVYGIVTSLSTCASRERIGESASQQFMYDVVGGPWALKGGRKS